MDNAVSRKHYTIFDWEQNLAPQVSRVELLGEITLTEEETQLLGQQLGQFISSRRSWGVLEVCEAIRKKCPCAFVTFLVAKGLYDVNAENGFWADVDDAVGLKLDPNWHRQFGLLFEEILDLNGLSLFPDMGGYRYVSPILAHGGIPNYSLPDYFRHLLRPAVTRSNYAAFSPTELIDEWLHHASGRFFSDKPVLRFLEFGGQVAVDFVERTRELAYEFLETGLVPSAEDVGLPERVIRVFHQWAVDEQNFEKNDKSGRQGTGLRLHRPEIQLDPWGEGLTLQLPPQQIPATQSQPRIKWEVYLDKQLETTLPVRLERVGYNLQTKPEALVLERPIGSCQVSLLFDDETQRTWLYDLSSPMLVFDPARETVLPWKTSLPARQLYLLYPTDTTLEIAGTAYKLEEFPALPWGWAKFKGEAWDLSQATQLTLRRDSQDLVNVAVRSDETTRRPHLVGGQCHQTFNLIHTPLYLGQPPTVRIPLVGRTGLTEELSRWRFTLYNPWPAAPSRNIRRIPLLELRPQLIQQEGYVDLPLNHPTLLGDAPMGNYEVRLRGPLGRDAELPLRLLPHLYLTGHERLYLPDPELGPPEIELLIETPAGLTLEAEAAETPCRVKLLERRTGQWTYQVKVSPASIEARLTAVQSQPNGSEVRVPLHVPLRRLRWVLTGDTERAEAQRLNWTGWTIKQSLEALEQTDTPVLFVDLGHTEAVQPDLRETLTLYLVDLAGNELRQQLFTKHQRDPGRSVWRFDLSAFLDTMRHSTSPVVRFELEYTTAAERVRLPVISLTRAIHITGVRAQVEDTGLTTQVKISWHEPVRLRHRRVRFWPVWQPWRSYREESIPDEAEGELSFGVIGPDFLIGKYLLEFLVVDPWTTAITPPAQPPPAGPNTATLELTPPEERLRQIEQGIQAIGPTFDLFLEHACIEADCGQPQAALADLWEGYKWFDQASLPQLLSMVDLVQRLDDPRLLTAVRLKLGNPERLRQLLEAYHTGQVAETHLDAYRNQMLRRIGLWSDEACAVLLNFPYEPVQIYALMLLIQRGAPAGGEVILQRLKNHHLSEIDGVDLFEINLDFAATFLKDRLNDPEIARLYIRLTERVPDHIWPVLLVRSGHFVHSCAGWGRINQIESSPDNRSLDCFLPGQPGIRLQVTLRPAHEAEPITIDLLASGAHAVQFKPVKALYRCGKWGHCRFITTDQNLLISGHNQMAHGGLSPQFAIIRDRTRFLDQQPPKYTVRAPFRMLD